jgi:hypothetical protein
MVECKAAILGKRINFIVSTPHHFLKYKETVMNLDAAKRLAAVVVDEIDTAAEWVDFYQK